MTMTIMKYDAVFISDVHLGTSRTNTGKFLSFLRNLKTKKLVLVGDILDIYCLEKYQTNWTREHTNCVHELIKLLNSGTEIVYVLGNHEGTLRRYSDFHYLNFSMVDEYTHIDQKGRKFLCVHGDAHSHYSSGCWRQLLFNKGYEYISPLNHILKKTFGFSLIRYLQNNKKAKKYINQYAQDLVDYCLSKDDNYSGVICGHIHYSEIRDIKNLSYMCCGDFCDTCTCITERNGIFESHII